MIRLSLSPEAETVRKELGLWLRDNKPPVTDRKLSLDEFVKIGAEWQAKLAEAHWIALHWPEEFGGRGLSLVEEAVAQEVLAEAGAPQVINLFGLTMVGPVLIQHGTDAQKKRFLQKILTAEELWCQGFSEPQAGSDLAAVHTAATKQEDGSWRLDGQKVWTSFAQYASWCFVLARTNTEVKKHKGLTYFLVPMTAEGITARPLTQISGDSEFNEVFFEGVSTAAENVVGDVDAGWKIAISTLMYERVILTFSRHLQSEAALREIRAVLQARGATDSQKQRLGELTAKLAAVRTLAASHLGTYSDSNPPGPEGSLDKLFWSETFQDICKFGLEVLGPEGLVADGEGSYRDGLLQHSYLYSRGRTIAAGTSEIQRSIIAERVLGLPKSR